MGPDGGFPDSSGRHRQSAKGGGAVVVKGKAEAGSYGAGNGCIYPANRKPSLSPTLAIVLRCFGRSCICILRYE